MSLISEVSKKNFRGRALLTGIATILWIGIGLHLFPVWWMVTTSLKTAVEIYQFPPTLWPHELFFTPYKLLFWTVSKSSRAGLLGLYSPIYVYLKNSFIMTGGIMLLQIPLMAIAAYSLSKLTKPRWEKIWFLFFIAVMFVPYQVSLIPSYLIIHHFPFPTKHIPYIPFTHIRFPSINFLNTYWAVILPAVYSAFSMLLFKGFFDTIPDELINAARLDGASEIHIFRSLVLPLSKPVFAVVSYFTFMAGWNSFIWPLAVIRKESLMPLTVLLYRFQGNISQAQNLNDPQIQKMIAQGVGMNGLMMVAVIQSIPVFIMFIIFREQLMKGIKLRGFK